MRRRFSKCLHLVLVCTIICLISLDSASACRLFGGRKQRCCQPPCAAPSKVISCTTAVKSDSTAASSDDQPQPATSAPDATVSAPAEATSEVEVPQIFIPEAPKPVATAPADRTPVVVDAPPAAPLQPTRPTEAPATTSPSTPEPTVPAPTATPAPEPSRPAQSAQTPPAVSAPPPMPVLSPSQSTPRPAPADDDPFVPVKPAPTPAVEEKPAPQPPVEEKSAPTPTIDEKPAPTPTTEEKTSPPPPDDDDPFAPVKPAPSTQKSKQGASTSAAPTNVAAPTSHPAGPAQLPLRQWTDNSGTFKVTARLILVLDGSVRLLKETGRTTTVPFARLSAADRQYVTEIVARFGKDLTNLDQLAAR